MSKDKVYYKVVELESEPILTLWSGVMTDFGGMAWNYVKGFDKNEESELDLFVKVLGWEKYEEVL